MSISDAIKSVASYQRFRRVEKRQPNEHQIVQLWGEIDEPDDPAARRRAGVQALLTIHENQEARRRAHE